MSNRNGKSATIAPATEAPATEAPATEAPATEAPATEAPATEAPATEAPAKVWKSRSLIEAETIGLMPSIGIQEYRVSGLDGYLVRIEKYSVYVVSSIGNNRFRIGYATKQGFLRDSDVELTESVEKAIKTYQEKICPVYNAIKKAKQDKAKVEKAREARKVAREQFGF